jgi:inorganic pyrophosphatase
MSRLLAIACATLGLIAAQPQPDAMLRELPPPAVVQLARSLEEASRHRRHVWRDIPPFNADGTINAYIEIPRGDRRKWEFDMRANARAIDRVMPVEVGGYPVNYGFVPQTIAPDGDPFDALVLGPPLRGGRIVPGVIVGLMHMADEKGPDSKVVLSEGGPRGAAGQALTPADQDRIASYFRRYKQHETGKFSAVPGWASAADGRAHVEATHAFFRECRDVTGSPCRLPRIELAPMLPRE